MVIVPLDLSTVIIAFASGISSLPGDAFQGDIKKNESIYAVELKIISCRKKPSFFSFQLYYQHKHPIDEDFFYHVPRIFVLVMLKVSVSLTIVKM